MISEDCNGAIKECFHGRLVRQRILSSVGGGDIGQSMPCGEWEAAASEEQKTAYRLNKMDNRWGLMGQAAERAIMWVLKEHQAGVKIAGAGMEYGCASVFDAKVERCLEGKWKQKPKQFCCLREHYYKQLDDNVAKREIAEQVKLCIENFITIFLLVLLKLMQPKIQCDTGDEWRFEHFVYEGVKVYAIQIMYIG